MHYRVLSGKCEQLEDFDLKWCYFLGGDLCQVPLMTCGANP